MTWDETEHKWKAFNADQPRDAQGRWAGGGAGLPGSVGGTNTFHPYAGLNKAVADHEALLMRQADERNHMPTGHSSLQASMDMHKRHADELKTSFDKIAAEHYRAQGKLPEIGASTAGLPAKSTEPQFNASSNLADVINHAGVTTSKTSSFHTVQSAAGMNFEHTFSTHHGATAEDITKKLNAVMPKSHEVYNVTVHPRGGGMHPLAKILVRDRPTTKP